MFPRLGLASLLACCWSLSSSGLFWESLGTVLCYFGGENAVRFWFLFFSGFYLCDFSVFLSFYICQVPFLEDYSAIEFFKHVG